HSRSTSPPVFISVVLPHLQYHHQCSRLRFHRDEKPHAIRSSIGRICSHANPRYRYRYVLNSGIGRTEDNSQPVRTRSKLVDQCRSRFQHRLSLSLDDSISHRKFCHRHSLLNFCCYEE
ncbi:hypothetical protein PENTCL1PPCAC_14892, partial [Pristionchus entomophagus]